MATESTISCTHCGQQFHADEPACPACGYFLEPQTCARHPGAEARGQCVICGDAVCSECNATSPHFTCPEHRGIPVVEGWAQVYSANEDFEAALIRDNLRSDGIDAEVLSQRDQTIIVDLGELAPVRVLVPAFDYQRAAELVAGHMDAGGELAFACGECGEAYDVGQDICSSCGAVLASSDRSADPLN